MGQTTGQKLNGWHTRNKTGSQWGGKTFVLHFRILIHPTDFIFLLTPGNETAPAAGSYNRRCQCGRGKFHYGKGRNFVITAVAPSHHVWATQYMCIGNKVKIAGAKAILFKALERGVWPSYWRGRCRRKRRVFIDAIQQLVFVLVKARTENVKKSRIVWLLLKLYKGRIF